MLRQRVLERDAKPNEQNSSTQPGSTIIVGQTQSQGKDHHLHQLLQPLLGVQHEAASMSDFDSALGGGLASSQYTRSPRVSQSDFEFSESYL